jgi:hypothetical protein
MNRAQTRHCTVLPGQPPLSCVAPLTTLTRCLPSNRPVPAANPPHAQKSGAYPSPHSASRSVCSVRYHPRAQVRLHLRLNSTVVAFRPGSEQSALTWARAPTVRRPSKPPWRPHFPLASQRLHIRPKGQLVQLLSTVPPALWICS